MNSLTRRGLLTAVPGTLLTTMVVSNVEARAAAAKSEAELFAVGPFLLGEWFAATEAKAYFCDHYLSPVSSPKIDDIVKRLNQCQLFLIDRRLRDDPKKSYFEGSDAPFAALVGKWHHVWNDKGKELSIECTATKAAVSTIRADLFPPTKEIVVDISLQYQSGSSAGSKRETYDSVRFLTYNVVGTYEYNPSPPLQEPPH